MNEQRPGHQPENDDLRDRSIDPNDVQLSAHALGQTDEAQREAIEARLRDDTDARQTVEETRRLAALLSESSASSSMPGSPALRSAVEQRLTDEEQDDAMKSMDKEPLRERPAHRRRWMATALAICTILLVALFARELHELRVDNAQRPVAQTQHKSIPATLPADETVPTSSVSGVEEDKFDTMTPVFETKIRVPKSDASARDPADTPEQRNPKPPSGELSSLPIARPDDGAKDKKLIQLTEQFNELLNEQRYAEAELVAKQAVKYSPESPVVQNMTWQSRFVRRIRAQQATGESEGGEGFYNAMSSAVPFDDRAPYTVGNESEWKRLADNRARGLRERHATDERQYLLPSVDGRGTNNEQYDEIYENEFTLVDRETAVSTFSIDVDTASYSNVRRFLTHNTRPPADAVRIEELVNYFAYDYPQPKGNRPFSVNLEVAGCPWRPGNLLLRVGLGGMKIDSSERPASNLVFLLDVSGSMSSDDKLPLLKRAMKMLVDRLTENDRVAIVTYAGNAGLRLDSTTGDRQNEIHEAIDALSSGGSTNGSAGIQLAYQKAVEHFIEGGTNRVILATDGDLNVGITADDQLVQLIQEKATSGVFLTVLGFGTGNLKDSKLEKLADHGNGSYGYVDSLREARKILVEQISGSLVTIAKDVKIQIEFNPVEVQAYRLIGYENRVMPTEDFDDDTKDAGEIGAGHRVTALYELVPVSGQAGGLADETSGRTGSMRYQKTRAADLPEHELTAAAKSGEWLTLSLRYKQPDGDASSLIEVPLSDKPRQFNTASDDFQFASAVAAFGMLLRNSKYCGDITFSAVEEIASSAIGADEQGRRTEFVDLVRRAQRLQVEGR